MPILQAQPTLRCAWKGFLDLTSAVARVSMQRFQFIHVLRHVLVCPLEIELPSESCCSPATILGKRSVVECGDMTQMYALCNLVVNSTPPFCPTLICPALMRICIVQLTMCLYLDCKPCLKTCVITTILTCWFPF